jgi:FGGY-family pentulose kinase
MALPRLLWVKQNVPQTWRRAAKFLDLGDFLLLSATGIDARSLGTAASRWGFDAKNRRWDASFFQKLGLEELLTRESLGKSILSVGTCVGELTPAAAHHLGLTTATRVAVGTIDTYAAGIGLLGLGFTSPPKPAALERGLAMIAGSSSYHLAVSPSPHSIRGIWGPFKDSILPKLWMAEAELSATGSLIDFIIQSTGRYDIISAEARGRGVNIYEYLNSVVADSKQREMEGPAIVKDLHVLPYFLGSRGTSANPIARGVISGLAMDDSIDAVAHLYYATVQAIAYGTRHIIETLNKDGFAIKRINVSGRGMRNTLLAEEYADITGCEIALPKEQHSGLLGTAILAAAGAGSFPSIMDAAVRMSSVGQRFLPRKKHTAFHKAKFQVFRKMYDNIRSYEELMEQF